MERHYNWNPKEDINIIITEYQGIILTGRMVGIAVSRNVINRIN
jgi:hypothetical protein